MRVRIHHGAHEIGGNCVEVAADDGSRILLDLGRPLRAGPDDQVALPSVSGLALSDPSLLGLLISHAHLDHYGLVGDVSVPVPLFIGREASAVLEAAAFFSPMTRPVAPAGYLRDREAFTLGPFTITPYLVDHSAFDSYALLIAADGRRVFYTGDFRGHGRKAALFERLLADQPSDIDVLLCEGTHVRDDGGEDDAVFPTERDLEDRLVTISRDTAGCVAVLGSAQNVDRVVTAFRAARRAGRQLVVDLYTATVAAATRSTIPQPGFDGLRVYVPNSQRLLVKRSREFQRVHCIRAHRVFADDLAASPTDFLMHMPSSAAPELVRQGVLTSEGIALWSLWDGYLTEPSGERLRDMLQANTIPFGKLHTSGHASVADLRRLVDTLNPRRVVPIHTDSGGRFRDLFTTADPRPDGVWWAV